MTAYAARPGEPWDLPGMFKQFLAESGLGGRRGPFGDGPGGSGGPSGMFGRGGPAGDRGNRSGWQGPFGGRPPMGPLADLFGGRHWGGPFGGGWQRGPRANRGDVRSAVLALLAEEPMHGYQIIQEISRRSGGSWKPSPGSVYPTLQLLEDEGLVRAEERDGKRVFRLTEDGESLATERADEFAELWQGMAPNSDDTDLGELVFQVAAAFVQVARTGSAAQLAAARTVLAKTKAELYQILGEDSRSTRADDDDDADAGAGAGAGADADAENPDGDTVSGNEKKGDVR